MANIKDNRRSQYTRTALRKALLLLMLDKPIDKITVKELCAAADRYHPRRGRAFRS